MLVRRRYYFWLLKAYIKRWKKTIITSVVIGISVFFALVILFNYYVFPIFSNEQEKIGYYGSYTLNSLPDEILKEVSYGLTTVDKNFRIKPGIARTWKISENGKVYTFDLKDNLIMSDGKKFDIKQIPYTFKDVKKKIIDYNTIQFTLKNPYAPFLSVLEKPIIYKNSGLNKYKIGKIEENSGFIKSLTLINRNNKKKVFYFYPTEDALKTAFQLGEVKQAFGFTSGSEVDAYFKNWRDVEVNKNADQKNLAALFFNTNDKILSNKKLRQALTFSLPQDFKEGERAFSFIPKQSIYYTQSPNEGILDLELSRSLLDSADITDPKITLQTSEKYLNVAKKIASFWKRLGVDTQVTTVEEIPVNFQVFLTAIKVPEDPDMYALWHSSQPSNIGHYKNVRIDKLLEDGRQEANVEERIRIYADIQKYLLDDAPAAFLYFPYSYTVVRR